MIRPVIGLMTDFGLRDTYVGVMKGVIAGIAPDANVIDVTHGIDPQAVHQAAYSLLISRPYFPADTIFCCVIDPGVGSARRAVGVRAGGHTFIYPDNGLLTPILAETPAEVAVDLDDDQYHLDEVTTTFHGRDIFSPTSAHVAAGVPLEDLGTPIDPDSLVEIEWPQPERTPDGWKATVIHADHFGNLITNLRGEELSAPYDLWRIEAGQVRIRGIHTTFADVELGQPVAYVGSDGFLELAVRQGNARRQWSLGLGTAVHVEKS